MIKIFISMLFFSFSPSRFRSRYFENIIFKVFTSTNAKLTLVFGLEASGSCRKHLKCTVLN